MALLFSGPISLSQNQTEFGGTIPAGGKMSLTNLLKQHTAQSTSIDKNS